jgi:serine/threonine protein kinase
LQVAVKRLKPAAQERELIILASQIKDYCITNANIHRSSNKFRSQVSEMQILKSIGHHPNILRLIGCCTGLGPLLVVLELCEHGNLRDFLRRHRPGSQQQQSSADWEEEERSEEEEGMMMMGEGTSSRSRGPGLEQHQRSAMYQVGAGGERRPANRYCNCVGFVRQNVDATTTEAAGASGDLIGSLQRQLTLRDLVQFATEIARGMDFLASKKASANVMLKKVTTSFHHQQIIHRDLAARNVLGMLN